MYSHYTIHHKRAIEVLEALTIDNNMLNTSPGQREGDSTTNEDSGELPSLVGSKYQLNGFNKVFSELSKGRIPSYRDEETQYPKLYSSQSCNLICVASADSYLMSKGKNINWIDFFNSAFTGIQETFTITNLRSEYILTNETEITLFLSKHSFLIPLLNEAYAQIQTYFPQSKVYLKISRDHESTEPFEELVAIINTDLSVEDTMRQLDEFDENWWDDNIDRAKDLLIIMV